MVEGRNLEVLPANLEPGLQTADGYPRLAFFPQQEVGQSLRINVLSVAGIIARADCSSLQHKKNLTIQESKLYLE